LSSEKKNPKKKLKKRDLSPAIASKVKMKDRLLLLVEINSKRLIKILNNNLRNSQRKIARTLAFHKKYNHCSINKKKKSRGSKKKLLKEKVSYQKLLMGT